MKLVGKMNHSLRPRSMRHWSQYESLSEKKKSDEGKSISGLTTHICCPCFLPNYGICVRLLDGLDTRLRWCYEVIQISQCLVLRVNSLHW